MRKKRLGTSRRFFGSFAGEEVFFCVHVREAMGFC